VKLTTKDTKFTWNNVRIVTECEMSSPEHGTPTLRPNPPEPKGPPPRKPDVTVVCGPHGSRR
jgi:hypothetical protein